MDPPSNVPFPTGSRIKISCKYCGHAMERINLKSHRNIGEDKANDEMCIAFNGPEIDEDDRVLK